MTHRSFSHPVCLILCFSDFLSFDLFLLCFLQILHSHIAVIERLPLTAAGSPLRIRTKIFNVVTFVISRERDCQNVYATLIEFSSPGIRIYCIYSNAFYGYWLFHFVGILLSSTFFSVVCNIAYSNYYSLFFGIPLSCADLRKYIQQKAKCMFSVNQLIHFCFLSFWGVSTSVQIQSLSFIASIYISDERGLCRGLFFFDLKYNRP